MGSNFSLVFFSFSPSLFFFFFFFLFRVNVFNSKKKEGRKKISENDPSCGDGGFENESTRSTTVGLLIETNVVFIIMMKKKEKKREEENSNM